MGVFRGIKEHNNDSELEKIYQENISKIRNIYEELLEYAEDDRRIGNIKRIIQKYN